MHGSLTRVTLCAALTAALSVSALSAAQVEVFSLTPAFSPFDVSGRTLTIKGIGFTAGTTVEFDGTPVTSNFINARTMVAFIPTVASARTATVTVTDPSNGSDSFHPFFHTGPVLYVSTTGSDGNAGTSPGAPKRTVAAALAAVDEITPTEIRVEEGLYLESQLELLHASILSCGWASGFGLRDPDGHVTEINGGRTGFVIRTSGLMNESAIDGCTIADGLRDGVGGGGIPVVGDSVVVNNNVIAGNISSFHGGGIYWRASAAYGGKPTFSNNVILGNRSHNRSGGGIGLYAFYNTVQDVDITIAGNQIIGNRSFLGKGGGVSLLTGVYAGYNVGTLALGDNIITHNRSKSGGGIEITTNNFADRYDLSFKNDLIFSNAAQGGGGGVSLQGLGTYEGEVSGLTIADNAAGFMQGGGLAIGSAVTLAPGFAATDMILWGNTNEDVVGPGLTAIEYSLSGTPLAGTGNISADPEFVSGQLGDYYLQQNDPNAPTSPAVDTGSGTAGDFSLEPITTSADNMVDANTNDMGYHFLLSIPDSANPISVDRVDPPRGDINGVDWILVRGDGFDPGAEVFFDSVPVSDQIYLNHRRILVRPAAHPLGFVTVRVVNPDATTDTAISAYLYLDNLPPEWNTTVGLVSASGAVDVCQRSVLLDWNPATDADSPPVVYEVYREECVPPLFPGVPCDNFGYIPNASNFIGMTTQSYYVDESLSPTGQAKEWVYTVRARDSATFFTNKEWNFGKRLTLGDTASTEIPPDEIGDNLRFVPGDPNSFMWTDPTGAVDYGFYRTANPSDYSTIPTLPLLITLNDTNNDGDGDGITDTTYTDPAQPPLGQAYYYKVSAIDSCGGETVSEILP